MNVRTLFSISWKIKELRLLIMEIYNNFENSFQIKFTQNKLYSSNCLESKRLQN